MFASTLDPQVDHFAHIADGREGPDVSFDGVELPINGVTFAVIANGKNDLVAETEWDSTLCRLCIKTLKMGAERIDHDPKWGGLLDACDAHLSWNQPEMEEWL